MLVPVELSNKLFDVLKKSHIVSASYRSGGGYEYTCKNPEERERALAIEYVELPTESALDPLSEWHKVLERASLAEKKLNEYADVIKAADEFNPVSK